MPEDCPALAPNISFIRDYDREKRAEQDERRRRFIDNYSGLPIPGVGAAREQAMRAVFSALVKASRGPSYDVQADADEDREGLYR